MEKQVSKEPNSVQMIDVHAAKLSDYSDPITKSLQLRSKQACAEPITSEHFVTDTIIWITVHFVILSMLTPKMKFPRGTPKSIINNKVNEVN